MWFLVPTPVLVRDVILPDNIQFGDEFALGECLCHGDLREHPESTYARRGGEAQSVRTPSSFLLKNCFHK